MKRLGWLCTLVLVAALLGPTSGGWAQDDGQEGGGSKVRKNKGERKAKADRPAKARRAPKTEWEAFWQPFAARATKATSSSLLPSGGTGRAFQRSVGHGLGAPLARGVASDRRVSARIAERGRKGLQSPSDRGNIRAH
jgi:hypothetical protein